MSCTCSCDFDYEPEGFNVSRWRLAVHPDKWKAGNKCNECGKEIQKGETYRYIFGSQNKQGYSYRQCFGCGKMAEHIEELGCCYFYGCLTESAAEIFELEYDEVM